MSIRNHSPHLYGILGKHFPADQLQLLELCFEQAIGSALREEIDFHREDGVSYNPRPARIGLILLNDASLKDHQQLAAGFLASIWPFEPEFLKSIGELPRECLDLAIASHQDVEQLSKLPAGEDSAAVIIALALRLDRARHLHQSNKPGSVENWPNFLRHNDAYKELAKEHCDCLHRRLISWEKLFSRHVISKVDE